MNLLEAVKRVQPFVAGGKDTRVALSNVAFDRGAVIATDGRILAIANKNEAKSDPNPAPKVAGSDEPLTSFPQWERVLVNPEKVQTRVAFERQDLIETLTFAVKLWKSFDKREKMRKSSPFVVAISKGEGETAIFNLHGTHSSVILNWDMWDGPEQTIAFNAEYLLKAVKACQGPSVTIGIQDDVRACVVTGNEDDFEVIVMPVNIRKD